MKKTICLLSILMISFIPIFGQTYVGNSTSCTGTITRDAGGHLYQYMKTGTTTGYFFTTNGGLNPAGARSYSGYNIQDFTILGDTIYICGNDHLGVGFYGWAKMTGPLNSSWIFTIYKLYNNILTEYISNVRRIRAYYDNNRLNVLLIGNYVRKWPNFQRSSLIHIMDTGNHCTVAYGDVEYFDDVEVLDNYVVTVERKNGRDYIYEPHYMRVLYKHHLNLYDPIFNYYSSWGYQSTIGRIRLQHCDDNNFVSVYRRDTAYYINPYTVSNDTIRLSRYYTVQTDTIQTIQELSYNDTNSQLIVLYSADTVGSASIYDCLTFPNISWVQTAYPDINSYLPYTGDLFTHQTLLTSVAKKSNSEFLVTGVEQNRMVIWFTNNCKNTREHSMTVSNTDIYRNFGAPTRITIDTHRTTLSRDVTNLSFAEGCLTITPGLSSSGDENEKDE